jgi:hypothetical protein
MNHYDACVEILINAFERMARERVITKSEILPRLVDFTASLAITLGGEDAVKACILRMGRCIENYHAGTFPVRKNSACSGPNQPFSAENF